MNSPIFEHKHLLIDKLLDINNHPDVINAPILDQQVFTDLRLMVDDDLMFCDLVTVYLDSAETMVGSIQASLQKQDFQTMRLSAHSLKSTSASIGAMKLSRICRLVEQALKEGETNIPIESINVLAKEYDLVILEIKHYVNQSH
jgi:HPt (histidine-containing phosphotransfer) domain-containing protein